ncbi:hypothetical protein BLNAU_15967 [Blattamonas nauphoetae]|uniref:Transmembrane protein n=1 Tax=Blattamonas nauphoetae TaxID=2049346 RepID=A0ABQ9XB29_9EUKA|nr:hypothetical protein BLNAU_15967 [Blattamonas nauphoetae]
MTNPQCATVTGVLMFLFGWFPVIYSFTYVSRYEPAVQEFTLEKYKSSLTSSQKKTLQREASFENFKTAINSMAFFSGMVWICAGIVGMALPCVIPDLDREEKKSRRKKRYDDDSDSSDN